jgi:hypothetical protein
MLHYWVYLTIIVVGPLSIAMIVEALLRKNNLFLNLETKTYEITYIGSISMFFLLCLGCGVILLFIWLNTHNWFVNNIFSISISIITIRIFKFTSFKFLLCMYILVLVYDYYWVINKSNYYGENYKLTNNAPENLPVNLICPELLSSPFSACNSLPIADIILPGLFLMYSKKFDDSKCIQSYFLVSLCSFIIGLLIHIFIYYYKMLPTPSFLFTGTLILIATLTNAYAKQDFFEFVEGFTSTVYENKAENNLTRYFENQRKGVLNYSPPQFMEMDELNSNESKKIKN